MSRRRKVSVSDEVVGGTPPTASFVRVTLIAACKIDGVRHLPGEQFDIPADKVSVWRQKGLIVDPDSPPVEEFAWLSRP